MRPALSVVAFTVLSGAGLGALALLALADLAASAGLAAPLAPMLAARAAAVALALVVAGFASSSLHLANPRNAWRSLSRWRTSWLSREALCAVAFVPVAALYVALLFGQAAAAAAARVPLALATVALAWLTLYCTSMIYASLKPIRQWHTRHVPAAYLLLGHASGAVVVVAILGAYGGEPLAWTLGAALLLAAAAVVKLDYYAYLASDRGRVTLEEAIGVPRGVAPVPRRAPPPGSVMRARLLDAGHSRGTFLTHEFGYALAPGRRTLLRSLFWLGALAVPALWLAVGVREWAGGTAALSACLLGMAAERWLFFAEARHTVRLYHGEPTT